MNADIRTEATTSQRFCQIRDRIEALVEHMTGGGKRPTHVAIFAGDYRHLQTTINRRLRAEVRAAERKQNEGRKRADRVKLPVELVDGLTFGDIPLQSAAYTRHRKVEP